MRRCKLNKSIEYILLAVTAFFVFGTIYYTVFLSQQFTNSDIFDTLMWANASYETKRIIAPNFNYAGLLPFGTSLFMLLFIKIFGLSFTAHALGMVMFEVIFIAVMIAFLRRLSFGVKSSCFAIVGMCGLWMCSDKMREMFMEHTIYYSLSILFIMAGWLFVESLEKSIESRKKSRYVIIAATVVFFMLVATDGIQVLAISTVPLLLGFALERYFDTETPLFSKKNKSIIIAALVVSAATVIGLVALKFLLNGVTSGYASRQMMYDSNEKIMNFWEKFASYVSSWYECFDVVFESKIPLTDTRQFDPLLKWLFTTILLLTLPTNLIFCKKIKNKELKRLIAVTLSLHGVLVCLWVFGVIGQTFWRLLPAAVMSFVLLIADVVYMYRNVKLKRFAVIFVVVITIFSINSYNYVLAYQPVKTAYAPYDGLITDINNHNIENGYADFWVANELIVLTKGDLKIETTQIGDDGTVYVCEYQNFTKEEHGTYDSPTFLVIPAKQEALFEKSEGYENAKQYLTDKSSFNVSVIGFVIYYYSCDIYSVIGDRYK